MVRQSYPNLSPVTTPTPDTLHLIGATSDRPSMRASDKNTNVKFLDSMQLPLGALLVPTGLPWQVGSGNLGGVYLPDLLQRRLKSGCPATADGEVMQVGQQNDRSVIIFGLPRLDMRRNLFPDFRLASFQLIEIPRPVC